MGSNSSSQKQEEFSEVNQNQNPEVALIICDLIRESEPPFKSERRLDHSAGALKALISWDKFMDDPRLISLKTEDDPDSAWTLKMEQSISKAAQSKTKLNDIRFSQFISKDMASSKQRKRALSTPKPKKSRRRSLSNVFTSSPPPTSNSKSLTGNRSISSGSGGTDSLDAKESFNTLEPLNDSHLNNLQGGTVLHCAALFGAVRLILWAVQEPSLMPLLCFKDNQGLAPLGVASRELSQLLKPFLVPVSLSAVYNVHQNRTLQLTSTYSRNESTSRNKTTSSSSPSLPSSTSISNSLKSVSKRRKSTSDIQEMGMKSTNMHSTVAEVAGAGGGGVENDANILSRSRRYHAIIQILRVDNSRISFNETNDRIGARASLSGLALFIANGSPCFDSNNQLGNNIPGYSGGVNISQLTWPNFANFKTRATPSLGSSSSAAVSPESSDPSNFDSDNEGSSKDEDEDDRKRNSNLNNSFGSPVSNNSNNNSLIGAGSPSVSNQMKFQQEQEFGNNTNTTSPSSISSKTTNGSSSALTSVSYKTYHITDVSCYFNVYKLISQFEMKMTSDGHLALDGFEDRFYSPLMHEACGWALQNGKSFKLMVPISNDGLASLLKPLLNSNSLEHVDLSKIGLSGKVPHGLGHVPSLTYIDLHENNLTGSIPAAAFGNLAKLRGLNLSCNSLNGAIPSSLFRSQKLMSSLWYLNLHTNFLSETLPISLCSCSQLRELWLNHNSLKGEIPEAIGGLVSLECLFLNNNDFRGKLPNGLSKLSNLKSLYLQDNRFTGSFPRSLLNLSKLKTLSLRNNLMDGLLPKSINGMSSMERLHLGSNQFRGIIPKELGDLKHLRHLFLDHNKFTGVVPAEALSRPANIQTICLYGNNQLLNKGRMSKEITKNVFENKYLTMNSSGPTSPKQESTKSAMASSSSSSSLANKKAGNKPLTNAQDEEAFIAMSRVKVTLLMINPNAPYSDDAENWRV